MDDCWISCQVMADIGKFYEFSHNYQPVHTRKLDLQFGIYPLFCRSFILKNKIPHFKKKIRKLVSRPIFISWFD